MRKGFKTRIFPDKQQEKILKEYCEDYTNMYNMLVNKYHKGNFPTVNSFGVKGYTPEELVKDYGKEVPKRIALGALKQYAYNLRRFFDIKNYAPPKIREKNDSFYVASQTYLIKRGEISIPSVRKKGMKMQKIKVDIKDLEKRGITEVIEPRFKYESNKWILSGCYNVDEVEKEINVETIGMDWGIKNFMTLSNGEFLNYPKTLLREYQRIGNLRRVLSKKKEGSKNFIKLNEKIEKAYQRLEGIKKDYIEQATTKLCKEYNVAVEEIYKIMRSKKFIRRQNAIYPRNRFIEKLDWKSEKFGHYFLKINPYNTSKRCNVCGYVNEQLTLKDRVYICPECGSIIDRDINAALNIKNDAEEILASMSICGTH